MWYNNNDNTNLYALKVAYYLSKPSHTLANYCTYTHIPNDISNRVLLLIGLDPSISYKEGFHMALISLYFCSGLIYTIRLRNDINCIIRIVLGWKYISQIEYVSRERTYFNKRGI